MTTSADKPESSLTAEQIATLRTHWNNGGRLSDWQIARLLDIAGGDAAPRPELQQPSTGALRHTGRLVKRGGWQDPKDEEYVRADDYEALRQRFEKACAEITRLTGAVSATRTLEPDGFRTPFNACMFKGYCHNLAANAGAAPQKDGGETGFLSTSGSSDHDDAERWRAFCNLWAASTEMKVAQDEDGGWSIFQVEDVEGERFGKLTGETPDKAIDLARTPASATQPIKEKP